MAFDPAKYIAEKSGAASSGGFDPQKYLAEKSALAEDHGLAAELTHKVASYLPAVGGIGGGILGGIGGAAVGAPAGPAAIATGAIGAGVGGAMGGAAGEGLRHVIDTQLGYDKPISSASDLGSRVADMGRAGFDEGESNAVGSAVTGLAMPVVKPIARAIAGSAKSAAAKLAARVVGGTAGEYRNAGATKIADMGQFLLDQGAVSPTSMSVGAVAKKLPEIEQRAGQGLTDAISGIDKTGGQFNKRDLLNKLLSLADEQRAMGPGTANVRARYLAAAKGVAEDIEESGPMMSFADAEKYKQGYQAPVNYAKANRTPLEQGTAEIAKAAREAVEEGAGVAAEGAGDPSILRNFMDAKRQSGLAQTASDMAEGAVGRSQARGIIGPTARMGGYMGLVGGLMAGHPAGAAAGLIGAPIAQYLKNRSVGATAVGLRGASNALSAIAKTEPWRLGPFAGILVGALNNGTGNEDEFNARSYALSQTEPGFQAIAKQLSEQK